MVAAAVYVGVLALIVVAGYLKYFYRKRREGEPPICAGHFLWGNAKHFAEHAVDFIHKQQAKCGNIFTIRLLNQHLTIINDPHTYERLCKEKNFDFDPIQKQVNHNVFSFELSDARQMIKEAGKKVKGNYLTTNMVRFASHLNNAFEMHMSNEPSGTDGLRSMASKTMFQAIFRTIFGKGKTSDVFQPELVYKNFDAFHKYFNQLWLGLPIKMFPAACRALEVLIQQPCSQEVLSREDVSEYIKFSTQFMLEHGQSETDIIGHNLVFLHVNYNTFRVTFWLIYFLTQHPEARQALLEEVNAVVQEKAEFADADENVSLTLEDVDRLPILDSILKEVIRLTSGVFVVRYVNKDTQFQMDNGETFLIREGDRVAMYPPALHKDPEIFENPHEFKYDRFVDAKFYKNDKEVKTPLLAFGSLCPGKKLALSQAKWYLFNLVHRFDFEVANGETCSPDNKYHGHEILPPTNDVNIVYSPKPNSRVLELVH